MEQNDNGARAGATTRRVNHKSDFSFLLGFGGAGGEAFTWPAHDWKAVFFTPASRVATFTASVIGGEAVNCFDDGGRVHVVARRHGLPPGPLLCELTQWLPDDVFPDGTRREVTPVLKGTGVELVEGPGDGATGIEVELTVPYAVIDAYMTARAAGFGGTMEEYYAGLAMLPSLSALVSDLAAGKAAVASALTRRGYATDPEGAMDDMAATIDAMGLTSVDFAVLGYTETPRAVRDAVDYALARAADWDPDDPSAAGFFQNDTALVYAPAVDCSRKANANNLFYNCKSLKAAPELSLQSATTADSIFSGCSSLVTVPKLDLPNATNVTGLFYGCSSLVTVPKLNIPKATNASYIFYGCSSLVTVPPLDLPNATNVTSLFDGCSSLVTMPELNLPGATTASKIFRNCSRLMDVPLLNLPNATNVTGLFFSCTSLMSVPPLDLPKATSANDLIWGCKSLVEAPELNLPKATNVTSLFYGCSSLTTSPRLDLPSAKTADKLFWGCSELREVAGLNLPMANSATSIFEGCGSLTAVPTELNLPKVIDASYLFRFCESLEYIPDLSALRPKYFSLAFQGCFSLRRVERLSFVNLTSSSSYCFSGCTALTYMLIEGLGTPSGTTGTFDLSDVSAWGSGSEENRRSLVDSLLTLSFDRMAAGYAAATIKLHADTAARLTAEEIAAITAKGFTITTTTSTT